MNLGETKKYIDEQLSSLGWPVHIDRSGYETIHQYTLGNENRVDQLYYKLVSHGSRRPKREINDEVVRAAIDDLTRMSAILESNHGKPALTNIDLERDRISIDQLAKALEMTAAPEPMVVERKTAAPNATSKPKVNGAQASARKVAGSAVLPTILIVDDSATMRAVFARALERNFTIVQAADGEEAWSHLLSNNDIELVVTDLMMPKLDGFGLISRIRTDRGSPHLHSLPIIVVTTLEDTKAKHRALVAGANDYINKNTETAELHARVLARYKHAQALKEAEWTQIASRNSKAAATPKPSGTSASMPATNTPPSPKSAASSHAQKSPSPRQDSTARKFVVPETPEPRRFSVDKVSRPGETTSNERSWLISSTGITLTATVAVALIIAAIYYFRDDSEVVDKATDVVRAGASVKGRVEGDPQQQSATNMAPVKPPEPVNGSPRADELQNVDRGVVAKKDNAVPKEQEQSTTPAQDASPKKVPSFRPDKSALPAEPAGSTPKKKLPRRADPAVVAQAQTPPKELKSESTAPATVSAPAVVAQAQLPKAQTPPETQNTAGIAAGDASFPTPSVAQPSQQSGTDAASSAMPDRMKLDEVFAKTTSTSSSQISQPELATLLKRFVSAYQAGDIEQFLSLFATDVRTNDRTSKVGLREDYAGLFNTTDMRQMVLGNVTWDVSDNQASGWGNFEVKVRKAGQETIKTFNGSLTFQVEKIGGQVQIKKLYHGQWRAGG